VFAPERSPEEALRGGIWWRRSHARQENLRDAQAAWDAQRASEDRERARIIRSLAQGFANPFKESGE
jgi:hypothetical protein